MKGSSARADRLGPPRQSPDSGVPSPSSAPVPRLGRREWREITVLLGVITAMTAAGWTVLAVVIVPEHLGLGGQVFGLGLGVTAYTLGVRHAFDADHIAAIDNTTRKLLADGQRPVSVGFWFALGHSSVVFGLCFLLGIGVRALAGQVESQSSTLQQTAGL